jgi:hypothetical protein
MLASGLLSELSPDHDNPISVAIHFGTFRLSDEGQADPPRDLSAALLARKIPSERFWVLGQGEVRDLPPSGVRTVPRAAAVCQPAARPVCSL